MAVEVLDFITLEVHMGVGVALKVVVEVRMGDAGIVGIDDSQSIG